MSSGWQTFWMIAEMACLVGFVFSKRWRRLPWLLIWALVFQVRLWFDGYNEPVDRLGYWIGGVIVGAGLYQAADRYDRWWTERRKANA